MSNVNDASQWGDTVSVTVAHSHKHEVRLGEISVWRATLTAEALRSAPVLACESDQDIHRVSFLLDGSVTVCWDGGEVEYGPYDLFYFDPARPSKIRTDETLRTVGVDVPKALVALPERRGEQEMPRPVSGRSGIGALFSDFLVRLATDAGSYRPADGPRLGVVAAELVSTLLAHTLDTERNLPAETRGRTLAMRIRAFIQQHLHDPHLGPRTIATAHNISISYLHRLFRREGVAVSTWIRQQRLAAARRDLADPALSDVPVHEIAARWGFPHHATFTRAFRTAYGDTPIRFRPDALPIAEAHRG